MTSVVPAIAEAEAGHPSPGRYVRMFPGLAPLVTDPRLLARAGDHGGICDAAAVPGPSGDDAAEFSTKPSTAAVATASARSAAASSRKS